MLSTMVLFSTDMRLFVFVLQGSYLRTASDLCNAFSLRAGGTLAGSPRASLEVS